MFIKKVLPDGNFINYSQFILIFIVSISFILACNKKYTKSEMELISNHRLTKESFKITLWQGGGFTGLTTGFTLSSSGEVVHWQRFAGQSNIVLWIVKDYLPELQKLKNQLDGSGLLEVKYAETGNITAGIKYELKDKYYIWTWNQSEVKNDNSALLREWYQKAMDFCESIQRKK